MRSKPAVFALCNVVLAAAASALVPAPELFLASVGRGQGACPGGVCAEWRTSVWVTNFSTTTTANVEIAFLKRGQSNLSPAVVDVAIPPGVSRQFTDIFHDNFNLDGVFGALRLRSNIPVIAWARTYDSNVHTSNKGVGGAGQDLPGIPFEGATTLGKTTVMAGLAQDAAGAFRSNFGMVEVVGQGCTVEAQLVDGNGNVLGSKSYPLLPYEAIQPNITDLGVANPGTNLRVRLTVTAGSGAVIGFGSLIDNTTGDATTSDQAHGGVVSATDLVGTWTGPWVNETFGSTGTVTIAVTADVPNRTAQFRVTLTGTVFGVGPPPPETEGATLTPDGIVVSAQSAFAGALSATIGPGGIISGQATPPNGSPIASVSFFGWVQGTQMNIFYKVEIAAAQGGGEAGGYASLTKS